MHFGHILYVFPTFIQPAIERLLKKLYFIQWRTQEFCSWVQQIQLRIEDRENGDLEGGGWWEVAP